MEPIDVEPEYVDATIGAESSNKEHPQGDPNAVSPVGAQGLMQLMPATGQEVFKQLKLEGEYDPLNPEQNRQIGTEYLRQQLNDEAFGGDKRLASAAYNWGPNALKKALKEHGSTYEDVAAHLPEETQKYVSRVSDNYNKLIKKKVNGAEDSEDTDYLLNTLRAAPPTTQGFAETTLAATGKDSFNLMPFDDQVATVSKIFQAKPWGKQAYEVYKQTVSSIWDTASPEETSQALQEMQSVIGPPPVVPPGKDPKDVLAKWQDSVTQKLLQQKLNPAVFGGRLETYLDNATKAETEAYALRAETFWPKAADAAGNLLRYATQGALELVTEPASFAAITGALPGENLIQPLTGHALTQEERITLGDNISKLPERLGKPSDTYRYEQDSTGKLKLNPDGTPMLHAESEAAQTFAFFGKTIGQVGGLLSGGWLAESLKVPSAAVTATATASNVGMLANGTFKRVYDDTKDADKAYTATLFTVPAAIVGSFGELGVISKNLRPTFATMSKYDQIRYIGQSMAARGIIGGAALSSMDAIQQYGETSQTGKPFDVKRNLTAAAAGTVISGALGPVKDYTQGKAEYNGRIAQNAETEKSLVSFRDSIAQQMTLPVKSIPADMAKLYGMEATAQPDGTLLVTKRTDAPVEGTLPELVKLLRDTASPTEVIKLGERQAELNAKDVKTPEEDAELNKLNQLLVQYSRPEHLNNIKAIEAGVAEHLAEEPGAMLVRYNKEANAWEDVETGKSSAHLKDVLFRPEPPKPVTDLSDISHVRILDEDAITSQKEAEPINPRATEESGISQGKLDKVNTEILKLQNRKNAAEDKETKKEIQDEINDKLVEKRKHQADLLRLKPTVDTEQGALEAQRQAKRERETDLGTIARIKKKGLGAFVTRKGKTEIVIPAGLSPEAKEQVTAHELAHAVSEKVKLPEEATKAVGEAIQGLKDRTSADASAREIANEVFMPHVRDAVKIPDVPASKLDRASKNALFSEKEFLANQIGALMLKRAGKDIGNYKILPEIEAALKNTKLPSVGERVEPAAAPKLEIKYPSNNQEKIANIKQHVEIQKQELQKAVESGDSKEINAAQQRVFRTETQLKEAQAEAVKETPKPPEVAFDIGTGKKKETAFSKTITDEVPNSPKTFYETASRVKGTAEAHAFIDKHGVEGTITKLEHPDSFSIEPRSRILLTDTALERAQNDFEAYPSSEFGKIFDRANQLRAAVGTSAGQQLGLLRRFRNTDTFPDLIASINKAYRESGQEPPSYTDYMLKELKAQFDAANKLPKESRLRNTEVQKIFEKTLQAKGISWGDFMANYLRTNLLSGLGTQAVTLTSGFWMGPVVTALSHPFQGGGLLWKAMWHAKGAAVANARTVLEGNTGHSLFSGAVNTDPVKIFDSSTPAKAFASLYNKFGQNIWKGLAATHELLKTFSGEGYIASKKFQELKAKFGDNPAQLAAEASKLVLKKEDINAAIAQAKNEAKAAGIDISESSAYARAYEILRTGDTSKDLLTEAQSWAMTVSHMGEVANPVQQLARGIFTAPIWERNPYFSKVRLLVQPFGRAMIALSDYAQDFIPGNILVEKLYRDLPNYIKPGSVEERSPALKERLKAGQMIGTVVAASALGLSKAGVFKITGDPEKELGENKGSPAKTRAEFKEFEQKGEPEYSVILPNGYAFDYKDFPGLNAILYGLYKFNKSQDSGTPLLTSTAEFYHGAFGYAFPFFGGGTLNSPIVNLVNEMLNPETNARRLQTSLEQFAVGATKMVTPFSSMLRDIQHIYDFTPEETHQNLIQKMFKDVPIASTIVGSRDAVDRFGDPIERTALQRVPGIGRVISEVESPSESTWAKLRDKGLYVKDNPNTLNIPKGAFSSDAYRATYTATREERLTKAYAKALTPDEWNDFRKATGPYIKSVAEAIANSDLPTDAAQKRLTERINAIELQAMKRYVALGHF